MWMEYKLSFASKTLFLMWMEYKFTFASNVFPHPGGPASKIPGGTVSPSASNSSGFCTGAFEGKIRETLSENVYFLDKSLILLHTGNIFSYLHYILQR